MAIYLGAHPGGKDSFALAAVFWPGRLPALLVDVRSYSSVLDVLQDIIGHAGEWETMGAAAIASPLTWSGEASGWRDCDKQLRTRLPSWAPKSWLRSPNALTGAVAVQGPALTWAMGYEHKRGLLPEHAVFETHPRASMAIALADVKDAILAYAKRDIDPAERLRHIKRITVRMVDAGILKLEGVAPKTPDELNAVVAAVTAVAHGAEGSGLVTTSFEGAPIRPVGKRSLVILSALP